MEVPNETYPSTRGPTAYASKNMLKVRAITDVFVTWKCSAISGNAGAIIELASGLECNHSQVNFNPDYRQAFRHLQNEAGLDAHLTNVYADTTPTILHFLPLGQFLGFSGSVSQTPSSGCL